MTSAPRPNMTIASAGLGSTILRATFQPRRFFGSGAVSTASPVLVYVLASTSNGLGASGLLLLDDARPLTEAALRSAALQLIVSIPVLYVSGFFTHGLLRLLGGTGEFRSTIRALGYGMAPAIFGVIPFIGLLGALWAIGASVIGLSYVHDVRLGRAVAGYLGPVVGSVLLALGLRAFVIEAFKTPSGSMFPTLLINDHLFVAKSAYGLLSKSAPSRGDTIVFEYPDPDPAKPRADFIKRVVAVPGDTLRVEGGHPYINGWQIPSCRVGRMHMTTAGDQTVEVEIFVEFLGGAQYLIALDAAWASETEGPYEVKDGEIWVLGDNRHNSHDSRSWNQGRGAGVPFDNVKGRGLFLWLPADRLGVRLGGTPTLPPGAGDDLQKALAECLSHAPSIEAATPPGER